LIRVKPDDATSKLILQEQIWALKIVPPRGVEQFYWWFNTNGVNWIAVPGHQPGQSEPFKFQWVWMNKAAIFLTEILSDVGASKFGARCVALIDSDAILGGSVYAAGRDSAMLVSLNPDVKSINWAVKLIYATGVSYSANFVQNEYFTVDAIVHHHWLGNAYGFSACYDQNAYPKYACSKFMMYRISTGTLGAGFERFVPVMFKFEFSTNAFHKYHCWFDQDNGFFIYKSESEYLDDLGYLGTSKNRLYMIRLVINGVTADNPP
jgi:hypothetical protein